MSGPLGPAGQPEPRALAQPMRAIPRFSHRLTRPWMFKAVLEKGKSMKSPPLSLRYLPFSAAVIAGAESPVDTSRLGFIVRKKTGNAVLRNSIRRVLREVFRARLPRLQTPTWFVFDVLPQASGISKRTLRLKGEELLERYLLQMQASSNGTAA